MSRKLTPLRSDEITDVDASTAVRKGNAGFVAMLTSRGGAMAVALLSNALMGRLLLPSDYGIVAMAATALSFLNLLRDFGLTTAVIQRKTLEGSEIDLIFWVNLALVCLCAAGGFFAAPIAAHYYATPAVESVLQAFSVGLFLTGATAMHAAILRRQLRFSVLMWSELISLVVGLVVGVSMAWWTRSYWAIVASGLATSACASLILIVALPWLPARPRWSKTGAELLSFGFSMTVFSLLNFTSNMLGAVLIGLRFGSVPLGHFNRAQQLYQLTGTTLLNPFTQVSIAVLSRLQSDIEGYRRYYVNLNERLGVGFGLIGAALIVDGESIVRILLGPNWSEAGVMLRWYGIAVVGVGLAGLSGNVMMSQGRVRELRWWGLFDAVIRAGGTAIGLLFGATGAVAGFSLAMTLITVPCVILMIGRSGPLRVGDQVHAAWPAVMTTAIATVFGLATHSLLVMEPGLLSLFVTGLTTLAGILCAALVDRRVRRILLELWPIVTRFAARRRPQPQPS